MDAVVEILKGLDYSPLYVSLKTGIVATIFSFFLGLFAARRVIKAGPKVKAIADGILTLPMGLQPSRRSYIPAYQVFLPHGSDSHRSVRMPLLHFCTSAEMRSRSLL